VLELVVVVSPPMVVLVVVVVGSRVVEVVGRAVVIVGRTVEVEAEVVAGVRPAVEAERTRGRGRVVVEEIPAKRLRGRVVEGATSSVGARVRAACPPEDRVVRNPSRLPLPAPSSTAAARIAHRRSMLNRTAAPRVRLLIR
jgi:hypothetical protein